MAFSRILIRATNWVGDAVMSLPAIRAVRARFPDAQITVLARPWVADLYARETAINRVIPYSAASGFRHLSAKLRAARVLRAERFDCAILLQNAFEAAAIAWLAGIPRRIGYARDGRSVLLTDPIPVPKPGDIALHQRFYYLELLRRAHLIDELPDVEAIRLEGREAVADEGRRRFGERGLALPVIGVSPGAAYGNAKRWLPERFAEAALEVAGSCGASVAVFGSPGERKLCQLVADMIERGGVRVSNLAGETALREFIEMAAACRVFLTNDSGAMHIASAAGVPTVAVFGATDDSATGPTGPLARVVREPVECSPCLLRECPIDHRCMTRVTAQQVSGAALELLR
ncbi:MAG TPA: lipopolysaccharide heptosyltransferase II [Bryobacteraceae bacterium]|nr:lipopolysaccharide heptosyltransferase II [Bryobacteraceae bacterium]